MSFAKTLIEATALGFNPKTTAGAAAVVSAISNSTTPIQGKWIPRTDTFDNLKALDGNAGELSAATDVPAILKHTGVAGASQPFMPFGATYMRTFTANEAFTLAPVWHKFGFDSAAVGATCTVTLSNGFYVGQSLVLFNHSSTSSVVLATTIDTGSNTTIAYGYETELVWSGTLWRLIQTRQSITNELDWWPGNCSINGGQVIGGNYVSGTVGSMAIGKGAAVAAANAVAIGSTSIEAHSPNELALSFGTGAGRHYCTLQGTTTSTSISELTLDGTAGASGTRFSFSLLSGLILVKIRIFGRIATTNAFTAERWVFLSLSSLGAPTIVGTVQTIGTDITNGTIGSPTITIGVTTSKLTVSVTPVVATSTTWKAQIVAERDTL